MPGLPKSRCGPGGSDFAAPTWAHLAIRACHVSGRLLATLALTIAVPAAASAACPIELATYADREGVAELEFTPTRESATVTNSFRMLLGKDVVFDGIVQQSQTVPRPYAQLMHQCPEGDVTGEELVACTVWTGVVYTSDEQGNIALLPSEGSEAPKTLILPDLGPSLQSSSLWAAKGFSKVPWDVFSLKGCQE